MEHSFNYHKAGKGVIKAWTKGVPVEEDAMLQLVRTANMPFIFKHVAAMPDVHLGVGATVGTVVATKGAIIPAAVGVDIGCGMCAVRLDLKRSELPEDLTELRSAIEAAVPHGRTNDGQEGDRGAWGEPTGPVVDLWKKKLEQGYEDIIARHPAIKTRVHPVHQLGTLGTGNHFVEIDIDETDDVWIMLHSGSRGIGNRIGTYFIGEAKKEMKKYHIQLADPDLAYLVKDTTLFTDYLAAVQWAQNFAKVSRALMLGAADVAVQSVAQIGYGWKDEVIDCHHNYVEWESHFGENVLVTRKGATRARDGEMGIIPGSMGAKSFIVRGKGNKDSFCSCSHGAGRKMSRTQAKKIFSLEDHIKATEGVNCRKDLDVIDETPGAYKSIADVMAAQADLVEIVHTLKGVLCVKG